MIKINAPTSVSRGSEYKGVVEIGERELKGARLVEVALCNEITYGGKEANYSCWKMSKKFSPKDARSLFQLPFDFRVEGEAPVTYKGKRLSSKWKLNVNVDVVGAGDRWRRMDVIMLR
ncbi:hypothetical protein GF412_05555 [Candidatus Micrarchaeota archaeon]|nr:hypothetical protein [Candidatus Micrarchaeota archaeon]MBD3418416.1 hypothetical protein [Candidatus Micrarchaeota archaeon]